MYATTAGIAAASPAAVAINASDIPGATTDKLADPLIPMLLKASIIPHTVPKSPIKGEVFPVVARKGRAFSNLLDSILTACLNALLTLSTPPNSVLIEPILPGFPALSGLGFTLLNLLISMYPA